MNNFRIDIIKLNSRNYTSKLVWDKTFLANYTSDKPALVVAGVNKAWDFTSGHYDFVFVQVYNSGPSFVYLNPLDKGKYVNQTDPDIISAVYHGLYKNKVVSHKTKIIIGIPANAGAAPTMSNLWNNRLNSEGWDHVAHDIKLNIDAIYNSHSGLNPEQFGGLMTWSILNDAMPEAWPPRNDEEAGAVNQKAKNAPAFFFSDNIAQLL